MSDEKRRPAADPGRLIALVDHPKLDELLLPVLTELAARGHDVRALVLGAGRSDRLAAAGVAVCDDDAELQAFFDATGPRLFLNAADMIPQHVAGIELDQMCRLQGIPSLTLEHAPFALAYDGPFEPHVEFAADMMAVIGEEDRRQYEALGVAPERLVVTGSPLFEGLVAAAGRHDPAAPHPGDIAIFGQNHTWIGPHSSFHLDAAAWTAELTRLYTLLAERFPAARIRIKPHPAEPHHGTDDAYREAIPPELADRVDVLEPGADNGALMLASALVIAFSSSVWLEARLLARPAAFFSLQERSGRLREDIGALGGTWLTLEEMDFAAKLAGCLEDLAAHMAAPFPAPLDVLRRYVGPWETPASQLIADQAETLLRDGPPPVTMPQLVFDQPHQPARRLWPGRTYADYVHLQLLADETMAGATAQIFVLALTDGDERLAAHLPLAFLTENGALPAAGEPLPYADDAFEAVVAPDVWTRLPLPEHEHLLAEMLRVARRRVVTSAPAASGLEMWHEVRHLLGEGSHLGLDFAAAPDTDDLETLHRSQDAKLRLRDAHNPASWGQALMIENLGLDDASLRAVRTSLQAAGYTHERRGPGMRRVFILTKESA